MNASTLAKVPLFKSYPPKKLKQIHLFLKHVKFSKGSEWLNRDTDDLLYLMEEHAVMQGYAADLLT
jgi:hypothetical protein